jgi:hypothetical protein
MKQAVFCTGVLLEDVCEHARPAGPEGVVEHRKPLEEVDLATESIEDGEPEFCEDDHDVLVEVVADKPGDSTIPPTSMDQHKSL